MGNREGAYRRVVETSSNVDTAASGFSMGDAMGDAMTVEAMGADANDVGHGARVEGTHLPVRNCHR